MLKHKENFENKIKNNQYKDILNVLTDIDNSAFFNYQEDKQFRSVKLKFLNKKQLFLKDREKEEAEKWEKKFRNDISHIRHL